MDLPSLQDWDGTRDALHQIAQNIGAVRAACADPLPNDLHYSLNLKTDGFSSGIMRCGGVLTYDADASRLSTLR